MTEIIYLSIYLSALGIMGIQMIVTEKSFGDVQHMIVTLDRSSMVMLLILSFISFGVLYYFYYKTKNKMIVYKGFPKYRFDDKKVHKYVLLFLIVKLIGSLFGGVGVLNYSGTPILTTQFSFIFNFIKIEEFFPIYYIICRSKKNKMYWVNILLFMSLKIYQGWSGFLLQVIFYELYFWEKKHLGHIKATAKKIGGMIISIVCLVGGAGLYKVIIPIRDYIRYRGMININSFEMSFIEAVNRLISRLTTFPVTVAAFQNIEDLKYLYSSQGIFLSEFKAFFKPLLPSFLFTNKNFDTLNTMIVQTVYSRISGTSASAGILGYIWMLFEADYLELIVWVIAFVFLFILTSSILKSFDNDEHDIRILYFLFLMKIALNLDLQMIYAYGYIGAIYMFILFRILGVIRRRQI